MDTPAEAGRPAAAPTALDMSAIDMSAGEFRALGHRLVERIADFLAEVPSRPAGAAATPEAVRALLGGDGLPETGADAAALLDRATDMMFEKWRLNAHPRSWGYVIGTPAPIGMLGDFLAAAINHNAAAWGSAPIAAELEAQVIRWVAELLGYPTDCGGLLMSGGNMANFVGFLTARRAIAARAEWDVRAAGVAAGRRLRAYTSVETHTWVQKAADLAGIGTDAIRWIPTDGAQRIDTAALKQRIAEDEAAGALPFIVIGSAGTVSTGAVDPLPELAAIARDHAMWFHVDGAYGGLAVVSDLAPADILGLREADSLAVDGHKWLFAPLEAGIALVRDRRAQFETFSYRPPYYHFDKDTGGDQLHYHEYGPQNSREFRALKVWLILGQLGRRAYAGIVGRNIELSREMHRALDAADDIEAHTQGLSIATFRYVPGDLEPDGGGETDAYLDALNSALVTRIQHSGEAYISNAVVGGRFLLRACITNFRTTGDDVRALPEIVQRLGAALDAEMRPQALKSAS